MIISKQKAGSESCRLFGTPGAIRTRGLSLRRRTLYPAELRRDGLCVCLWGKRRFPQSIRAVERKRLWAGSRIALAPTAH